MALNIKNAQLRLGGITFGSNLFDKTPFSQAQIDKTLFNQAQS